MHSVLDKKVMTAILGVSKQDTEMYSEQDALTKTQPLQNASLPNTKKWLQRIERQNAKGLNHYDLTSSPPSLPTVTQSILRACSLTQEPCHCRRSSPTPVQPRPPPDIH